MAAITTIITGATSGIGKATALALAKKGHALYLLVRDITKGNELAALLKQQTGNREIYTVKCDLADLSSVRQAADVLKSKLFAVNVLINNAGGIFPDKQLSRDGLEMTFATNHLGHFALTHYLLPLLAKGQARIINVSSEAHKMGTGQVNDINNTGKYSAMKAYGQAKLYNIYFTHSLADKYADKGITACALHPGLVNTGFGAGLSGFAKFIMALARPFMISPEKGAETTVYLATQPKLHTKNGLYFKNRHVAKTSAAANIPEARKKLWQLSEEILTRLNLL